MIRSGIGTLGGTLTRVTTLLVPDISEWQGQVDWPALVAAQYPAAIIRVYNGTRADYEYSRNREQAHTAGIRALGLYAYLDAGRPVIEQAAAFCGLVGHLEPGEWPIVDCETGSDAEQRVHDWVAYVAHTLGWGDVWQYSGESFYRDQNLGADGVPASRTWLAAYGPTAPSEAHELWQYTDHRTVTGISGPVDCSEFAGDITALLAAVGWPAKTTPTPGPTTHPRYPYPEGIHPGGTTPSARPLQQALKRTGWMPADVVESDHYGPATSAAVEGFNAKHGLNSPGVDPDPAIGPRGWALLMTLAYGAT